MNGALSTSLAMVVYSFAYLDFVLHYTCAIAFAVMTARLFPKSGRATLAAGAMMGVLIAFGLSYATSFVDTGSYRTWWYIEGIWGGYYRDVWREAVIPPFLLFVFAPFYLAWLVARACHKRWVLRPHTCSACGYDLRASKEKCPECGAVIPVPAKADDA